MKANKFLALALAALAFVGCEKKENGTVSYKLDKTELTVKVGESAQVNVTPAAEAVWTSSKPEIATVANGLVTGVAEGTAVISAKVGDQQPLSCVVYVKKAGSDPTPDPQPTPDPSLPASLQGSNYYVFLMDGESYAKIEKNVAADLRPNDETTFIDVWASGETYAAGTTSGLNFYGEADGWTSFTVVAPAGWSGGGIRCTDVKKAALLNNIMTDPDKDKYYFHIGMKSTDKAGHHFRFYGTSEVDVVIGTDFEGKAASDADFTRNGSWGEIEIPMTTLFNRGLIYSGVADEFKYVLGWVSGGQIGAQLQMDACFIYKKK